MDRSVCQVANDYDKTTMTIITEWLDDETINVTVFRKGMIPLSGQTTVSRQLDEYNRPGVQREKSLTDMRNELSGKEKDLRFVLKDEKLSWKKKAWWRGGISVHPVKDTVTLADMSLQWLNEQARLQYSNAKKQEEDKQKSYTELVEKLRVTEAMKKSMEDTLYAKFLLVLNEKKKKIRDLQEALKSHSRTANNSAYDGDTDDKSDDHSEESMDALDGLGEKVRVPANVLASTSKNVKTEFDDEYSSESENEIVLKFDDTRDNSNTEEESDDLFSQ